MLWRAPFRPLAWVQSTELGARRKGHAIAHTPQAAPCLRILVGYLALSLPGESVLEPGFWCLGGGR